MDDGEARYPFQGSVMSYRCDTERCRMFRSRDTNTRQRKETLTTVVFMVAANKNTSIICHKSINMILVGGASD